MPTWLIVLIVVIVLGVVALVVANPMLRKKESAAAGLAKAELGDEEPEIIEARAVGFGTDADGDPDLKGMGVLAANSSRIVFVKWAPQQILTIDRASVVEVRSPVENVEDANKAMIEIVHQRDGEQVVASFRVPEPTYWLTTLSVD
ncbi:MAG: hypothetical protein JJU45_00780 [Acidimicrobiia bacterium]|nr:hypothetical protein [Acidimicrobiia bacterium]